MAPLNHRERSVDLALAARCVAGDSAAFAEFEHDILVPVVRSLSFRQLAAIPVDDVIAAVRDRVLPLPVGTAGKIESYVGKGSLEAWLRLVAIRVAKNLARQRNRNVTIDGELGQVSGGADRHILRRDFAHLLQDGLHDALLLLPLRQRNLLRLYYLDGMSMDAIAATYGVGQATVSRWRSQAVSQLREHVKTYWRRHVEISTAEFESIVRTLLQEGSLNFDVGNG